MNKLIVILIFTNFVVADICPKYGKQCPSTSPCCSGDGFCSSNPEDCLSGCNANASYKPDSCYPRPPCVDYSDDFTSSSSLMNINNFNGDPSKAAWLMEQSTYSSIANGNLNLWMQATSQKGPTGVIQGLGARVSWSRWIQYGNVTVRLKTATGGGVVTSFIARSGVGSDNNSSFVEDEIDYEWVGGDLLTTETNYYAFGNLSYNNVKMIPTANTFTDYHTYMVQWQPDLITWWIDGVALRTLYQKDVGTQFPSRLSRIQFSIWDSNSGAAGTVSWAKGPTDWSNPTNPNYKVQIDSVNISCYYKGNGSWTYNSAAHTSVHRYYLVLFCLWGWLFCLWWWL